MLAAVWSISIGHQIFQFVLGSGPVIVSPLSFCGALFANDLVEAEFHLLRTLREPNALLRVVSATHRACGHCPLQSALTQFHRPPCRRENFGFETPYFGRPCHCRVSLHFHGAAASAVARIECRPSRSMGVEFCRANTACLVCYVDQVKHPFCTSVLFYLHSFSIFIPNKSELNPVCQGFEGWPLSACSERLASGSTVAARVIPLPGKTPAVMPMECRNCRNLCSPISDCLYRFRCDSPRSSLPP